MTSYSIYIKYFLIAILPFLLVKCSTCEVDESVKQKIEQNIEVIQQRYNCTHGDENNFRSAEDMFKSMVYLGHLTGHNADNPLNYRQTYTDTLTMYNDFKAWRDWYEANKCGLTLEKADSIVKYQDSKQ